VKEEVLEMGLDENEVKEMLDDHGRKLEDHEFKIQKLEVEGATVKEKINGLQTQMTDVKDVVTRFENNYLQTTNSMMNTMTQLVLNTSKSNIEIKKIESKSGTEITKVKSNNIKDILISVFKVMGTALAAFFAAKYGISK